MSVRSWARPSQLERQKDDRDRITETSVLIIIFRLRRARLNAGSRRIQFNQLVLDQRICYVVLMSMFAKHSRCIRFLTVVVPLFMVFVGMKAPDFSRPLKPKPMRRAVLEKTSARTIVQSVVKTDPDPVIPSPPALIFLSTEEHPPEAHAIHWPVPLLSLRPLSSRAPPASNPFA